MTNAEVLAIMYQAFQLAVKLCLPFLLISHDIRMNCFPSSFSKYLVFKNLIPVPKTPLGSY